MYLRVGPVVINLTRLAERSVRFYKRRDTAVDPRGQVRPALDAQHPCRAFRADAVRLQLFALSAPGSRLRIRFNPIAEEDATVPNGIVAGLANLTSQTGETIQIGFSAVYSPPTAGSSAWNVNARNISFTLTVPVNRPLPTWFMAQLFGGGSAQAVILQSAGGPVYSGTAPNNILIRSGSMGMSYDYVQMHEFTPQGAGSLIDPINGTSRFQTNLFFATSFATTPQGMWTNI
jgi:hypothetical protein